TLSARLGPPNWEACARAFMTTDTYPKGSSAKCKVGDATVHITGIAKGSGMIAPNMATMLAYIFTDAAIAPAVLDQLLKNIADVSFNAISVDGDTSTSDTLMIFATGASDAPQVTEPDDQRLEAFTAALKSVCLELAHQIVKDGEGATKFIEIMVEGAPTDGEAKIIAASIANSPLVKTALAAGDANWGRVVMAAGKAGVDFDQSKLNIWFGDHQVAENGARADSYEEDAASAVCKGDMISIRVNIGDGLGQASVYTCDLTHAYVDINGAYRT
ncbi:MAG: bifunctional glutamate N-acetyltransferase/amino-acid acetyltransferase ArgJ, partial [Pseudomonadota bacterium]